MNVYLFTYDLNKPGQNYQALFEELKKSPLWWHYLDSTWLLGTNETADQIWARVSDKVDKSDSVLITRVTRPAAGWLPQDAWKWINEHVA